MTTASGPLRWLQRAAVRARRWVTWRPRARSRNGRGRVAAGTGARLPMRVSLAPEPARTGAWRAAMARGPGPSLPSAPRATRAAGPGPAQAPGRGCGHLTTGQLVKCPPKHPHHACIHSEPGRVGPGSHAASGLRGARVRELGQTRMDSNGLGWVLRTRVSRCAVTRAQVTPAPPRPNGIVGRGGGAPQLSRTRCSGLTTGQMIRPLVNVIKYWSTTAV